MTSTLIHQNPTLEQHEHISHGQPEVSSRASHRHAGDATAAGLTAGMILQIVLIHLIDQDWFAFAKGPSYIQSGYTSIEIAGVVIAGWLILRRSWLAWGAAVAIATGPLLGFVASRGPGLPNYTDDMGNWFEPLGVASVLVELAVIAIAGRQLLKSMPNLRTFRW